MRYAIDARLNAYRIGGIPQYTRQLATKIAELARDDTLICLQHREHHTPLVVAPNVDRATLYTPPHHRWEPYSLPLELLPLRAHLVHFPDFIAPRLRPCKAVITIHDLAFLHYPEILDDQASRYYRQIDQSARHADAIIAVSHATAEDIVARLNIPRERIDVIYEAAGPSYMPIHVEPSEQRTIGETTISAGSFLLFVSTLEPRKNLPMLLHALRICRDRQPGEPYRLLVVGARGWREHSIYQTIQELHLGDAVHFLGAVSDDDLCWLYNACRMYLNPSRYEGFGLPLLEALACGAACLASNRSSLPEIGGDAAHYLPAEEPEAWAEAITALWHDEQARQALGQRGIRRAREFSWARAARETLDVYRRVAG
jgi:glycosyltransferase involved in cell wall biosynthesis